MGLLRSLFGPSKDEIWRQLCSQSGGTFVEGGFFRGSKALLQHEDWTLTLDTYTVSSGNNSSTTYTRMRAPYVNADGFRFQVYREGLFSGLGRLFGMQDVQVGQPEFDRDFVIKGNSESKLRALFANARIRELIRCQPRISFSVRDDQGWFSSQFPEGVDELYFSCVGVIRDLERLKDLYDLFAETLEHLCEIGSAYEDPPNVNHR